MKCDEDAHGDPPKDDGSLNVWCTHYARTPWNATRARCAFHLC